jgi:predicted nuclease of predicted toxin-antitoxin system
MNLLADESVDRQVVERLRGDGHDVLYIAEINPSVSDDIIFVRANELGAVLVTADKDFGDIVFRDKRLNAGGIMLVRLAGLSPDTKAGIVSKAIADLAESEFQFCVVSPGKVRIHRYTD